MAQLVEMISKKDLNKKERHGLIVSAGFLITAFLEIQERLVWR
jgi:hypothetical protein